MAPGALGVRSGEARIGPSIVGSPIVAGRGVGGIVDAALSGGALEQIVRFDVGEDEP